MKRRRMKYASRYASTSTPASSVMWKPLFSANATTSAPKLSASATHENHCTRRPVSASTAGARASTPPRKSNIMKTMLVPLKV